MKSYKVVEFGKPLQKVEEANPAPQGSEVLVRITAAGVCHSDVHLWEGYFDMGGGNKYEKTMAPPRTMGHEIVGEVAELGPDAKGAKVGDKDNLGERSTWDVIAQRFGVLPQTAGRYVMHARKAGYLPETDRGIGKA